MKIAVTRRQRFMLAQMFLHRDLRVAGVEDLKRFNRTRLALRLQGIMSILGQGGEVNEKMAADEMPFARELSDDQVDYLLSKIAPLEMLGYQAIVLAPLFETLETYKLTREAPPCDAPELDAEVWELGEDDLTKRRMLTAG